MSIFEVWVNRSTHKQGIVGAEDLHTSSESALGMCGIAGYVSTSNEIDPSSIDAVRRMSDRMRKRGPDAEGIWTSKGVVLGHRRLAILDLDRRSNQPMVAIDGNYAIAFNGEIYNFRELRTELEAKGVA